MAPKILSTRFAPAERRPVEEVCERFVEISAKEMLPQILDAMPNICLVINEERQIVFANKAVVELTGVKNRIDLCGLRPGEALNCVHADESDHGCGTTLFCRTCGAVNAILTTQKGVPDVQECRIKSGAGAVLDLRVWTTPIEVDGRAYVVFSVADISDEKRRRVLERVFFHDILNTVGALRGFCSLLGRRAPDEAAKITGRIERLATRLLNEIDAHRQLSAAENEELSVKPSVVESDALLDEVVADYSADGGGPAVRVHPESERVAFVTDLALVRRVLDNLVRNAVEACSDGQAVTVRAWRRGSRVEFHVHNPASMPRDVRLQVFQRSFSTKGEGRGLGTYSVKLLTERYLKGKVRFTSSRKAGTTFVVTYPLSLAP